MGLQIFNWLLKACLIQHFLWQFALIWRRSIWRRSHWLSGQICEYGRNMGSLYTWNSATVKAVETSDSCPPEKAKVISCQGKSWCHFKKKKIFNVNGILKVDFLQKGHTLTGQYCVALLWQLQDNNIAESHGKLIQRMLFHQDNAPHTISCHQDNNSQLPLWTYCSPPIFSSFGTIRLLPVPKP